MTFPFSCILFGTLFYVAHKLNACSTAQDDPRCGIWVPTGFCQNSFYTCDQKRTYCGSACNIGSCNPLTTCSSSGASSNGSCTDSSSSCLTWVTNGFCTATFYTCNQKMQYCAKSCNIGGCNPQVTCGSGGQTTTTNTTIAPTTQSALGTCTITYSNTDISPGSHDITTKLGQITDCCGFCNSTAGCKAYVWDNGQGGECWLKSATGPLVSNTAKTSGILNQ